MSEGGVTERLVARARACRWEDVPEDAREAARQCLLDFSACALAGAHEPLTEILAAELAAPEAAGPSTLIGRGTRTTAARAALVNGAAGHALDFDDTHVAMMGHPTVPVAPAVLALAESEGVSGRRLLEAFVAGFELECRVGLLLGARHYAVGFHATATVGSFGAAAAAAHLLGLDDAQWRCALGLAGTQAAGLKASFGTMAKPLHAGRAAAIGVESALLARAGFTACDDLLERAGGFAATHHGAAPDAALLEREAGRFFVRETLFKYHAACYLTHAAIDAAAALRDRHGLDAEDVEAVEVTVAPALFDVCNIENPTTGLEGKFSLRATVAMALRGQDTTDPATFSDAIVGSSALRAVLERVRVDADESFLPSRARVRIRAGGASYEDETDTGTPAADLAAQRQAFERKFHALAAPVVGADGAQALVAALRNLDEAASLAELAPLLAGAS